ncbi:MAG: DUF427 domain-containing protein [Pirellulaceae bacterium]|nr:DUF427 domain-containing protein [Pirellulaceae bacterium]
MNRKRISPMPGQESVWDYPRPPRLESCSKRIRIVAGGISIVDTCESIRVLETSHPPVYYFAPSVVRTESLQEADGASFCEWKGYADYYSLQLPKRVIQRAAWSYQKPTLHFAPIAGYIAFYPGKMDACYVDEEQVVAQVGDFYGGWITRDIVGPFKGAPGTLGW